MIRKAGPKDTAALGAFLEAHIDSSMFLLGNLDAYGTDNTDHPYGTTFFLQETGDGIIGVFGATNGGLLMCQIPRLTALEAQTYSHLLKGYTLRGMTGATEQVALILNALPLTGAVWQINHDEPLCALDLAALAAPDATLRAPADHDRDTLTGWFDAYMTETRTHPGGRCRATPGGDCHHLWPGAPVGGTRADHRHDRAEQRHARRGADWRCIRAARVARAGPGGPCYRRTSGRATRTGRTACHPVRQFRPCRARLCADRVCTDRPIPRRAAASAADLGQSSMRLIRPELTDALRAGPEVLPLGLSGFGLWMLQVHDRFISRSLDRIIGHRSGAGTVALGGDPLSRDTDAPGIVQCG